MRWRENLWKQGRHHLFKGSAFVVTACLSVIVFIFYPKWINSGLDMNLGLVKWVGKSLDVYAQNWGDRFETFTRFFNLERILLFSEAVAVVKLIMLAFGAFFRGSVAIAKKVYRSRGMRRPAGK